MHATPHDALFKAAFSDLGRAAEELRHALGPELAGLIDFETSTMPCASTTPIASSPSSSPGAGR